jgi:vitamin B12 transport system substrate-binding protein
MTYLLSRKFLFTLALLASLFILSKKVSSQVLSQKKSQTPLRIITLSPHLVEILYAIGAGDRIIATVEHSDYPKSALKIPIIGNYSGIQIEKILRLKPDLIIAWKKGNHWRDLKKLQSLGIPLYNTHIENMEDLFQVMKQLSKRMNLHLHALPIIKTLEKRYRSIEQRYSTQSKIRVFYQLWDRPLRSVGKKSWVSALIRTCSGENIFNTVFSSYPLVSIESVILHNPQIMIIPTQSSSKSDPFHMWMRWKNISAIKHHQLYRLNADLLQRFTPRAIDGLTQLCQSIDIARIQFQSQTK